MIQNRFRVCVLFAGALSSSVACSSVDERKAESGNSLAMNTCPSGTSNIEGRAVDLHVARDGTTTEDPWITTSFAALVGDATSPTKIEGQIDAAGKITIPCVPNGSYVLEMRTEDSGETYYDYQVDSSRTIALGERYGWPASAHLPAPGTTFKLKATGTAPVSGESSIDLNNWGGYISAVISEFPGTEKILDVRDEFFPFLSDAAGTERIYGLQRQKLAIAGVANAFTIARAAATDVVVKEGAENLIQLNFADSPTKHSHLTWNVAEIERVVVDAFRARHTSVDVRFDFVAAWVEPTHANTQLENPLFYLEIPNQPRVDADITYAYPYESNWSAPINNFLEAKVKLSNGAETWIGYRFKSDTLGPNIDVSPRLSPVTNIRVNGQDASGPVTNATLTPKLTWSPPTFGKATGYRVTINKVDAEGVYWQFEVGTKEPKLDILAGWLEPGAKYAFGISARYEGDGVKGGVREISDIVDPGVSGGAPRKTIKGRPKNDIPSRNARH